MKQPAMKPDRPTLHKQFSKKIERCSVFVADVSIINNEESARRTSNPNVLFETGYAVSTVGWESVILAFSKGTGDVGDLPFDIRGRRILAVNTDLEPSKLVTSFEEAITAALNVWKRKLREFLNSIDERILSSLNGQYPFTVPCKEMPMEKIYELESFLQRNSRCSQYISMRTEGSSGISLRPGRVISHGTVLLTFEQPF
ncbi:hypothetical protein BC832DRAFT_70695 [Gaertneriomyces semiglobifer]|nr:hypothetical protein BC832DRAFT_399863 [Gaertneriomyces semiglobifer]KAI9004070.1 hypothetical protein BC832DRAFT_70695 [Gaertneriomyces semiglobifer]